MPYRVIWPNGVIVEIETAAELVAYERLRLGGSASADSIQQAANQSDDPYSEEPTIEDAWDDYLKLVSSPKFFKQRRALALIKGAGEAGITIQELARQLRVDGSSAGGTIGAINKTAHKVGLSIEHIIRRTDDGRLHEGYLLNSFKPPEGWP